MYQSSIIQPFTIIDKPQLRIECECYQLRASCSKMEPADKRANHGKRKRVTKAIFLCLPPWSTDYFLFFLQYSTSDCLVSASPKYLCAVKRTWKGKVANGNIIFSRQEKWMHKYLKLRKCQHEIKNEKPQRFRNDLGLINVYPDLLIVNEKLVAFPIPDLEHGVHVQTAASACFKIMMQGNSSIEKTIEANELEPAASPFYWCMMCSVKLARLGSMEK